MQKTLPNWFFTLNIEIKNQSYQIIRYTHTPSLILLNNNELALTEFYKKISELFFDIPNDIQYISYRSLLPFF